MSDPTEKPDPRQVARNQTARLRDVLKGKAATSHGPPPSSDQQHQKPRPEADTKPQPQVRREPVKAPPQGAKSTSPSPSTRRIRRMSTVGECLQTSGKGRVAQLIRHTEKLAQVNQVLRDCLPSPLNDHATLAAMKPSSWVVQTNSPAWAYRLRYALPKARIQLKEKLGVEVPPLKVRVSPASVPPPPPPPRKFVISTQAAGLLESAAQSLPDPGLRASLNRLAQHARQRNRNKKKG